MEYTKKVTSGAGFSVSLPQFEECPRMNDFYGYAREIITENFRRAREETKRGFFTADFSVTDGGDGYVTVTVRRKDSDSAGKCEAEKKVSHEHGTAARSLRRGENAVRFGPGDNETGAFRRQCGETAENRTAGLKICRRRGHFWFVAVHSAPII